MVETLAREVPPLARRLITEFWPGGLTLVFQASERIPSLLTAGTGKIGIRLSSHPIGSGLAQRVGLPITGTSANVTGEPPCVRAEQVLLSVGRDVEIILDGGETEGEKVPRSWTSRSTRQDSFERGWSTGNASGHGWPAAEAAVPGQARKGVR